MDYYNFNRNDTLDFLCYPTQRHCGNVRKCYPECSLTDKSEFLKADPTCPWYPRPALSSSASLILKKTTEREIQQQSDIYRNKRYSNFTNSIPTKFNKGSKTRPIIKVTVIPNNSSSQSKLRKRRSGVKKIQSSVSNQENSIPAQNVYLVIKGKNREKVYEIRTTGSADFSSSHLRYVRDDEVVEENITQLLNSLNMDKKKKSKKKKEFYKDDMSDSSATHTDGADKVKFDDCVCDDSLKVRKSRVRITGKIGLTDDDRYVLRCAATVDGKPVETNFTEDQNYSTYPIPPNPWECRDSCNKRISYNNYNAQTRMNEENKSSVQQREVNVQVSLDTDDKNKKCNNCPFIVIPCKGYRSIETQCTPGNFNSVCFSNIDQLKIMSANTDQMLQCSCPTPNIGNMQMGAENEKVIPPKSCQSPLVIISVYPKPESEMDTEATPSKSPSPRRSKRAAGARDKSPKSRSPSPSQGRSKNKTESKGKEGKSKKTKGKESVSGGEVTTISTKSSRKETVIQQTNKKNTREANVQANLDQTSSSKQKAMTGRKPGQLDTHNLSARTISKLMRAKPSAKDGTSKNTINIDNERDVFDVLLKQAGITTQDSYTSVDDTHTVETDSLENFLLVSDPERKRSFSQTFILDDQNNGNLDLESEKVLPSLAVRDSLEVSHRREEKNSIQLTAQASHTSSQTNTENNNQKSAAPSKHYRGDCCDLFNPVERDKEIRLLLGVKRTKQAEPKDAEASILIAREECSVHCFIHAKRSSNLTSKALYNRFPQVYMTSKSSFCECDENDSSTDIIGDNSDDDDDICKVLTNRLDAIDVSNEQINKAKIKANDQKVQKRKIPTWKKNENNEQIDRYRTENNDYKNCRNIQCQKLMKREHPFYQQHFLNRKINIYLEIEQFTKQKPIVLSRQQYNKVKRTIESANLRSKTHCICKKSSTLADKKSLKTLLLNDNSATNMEIKKSTTKANPSYKITKPDTQQDPTANSENRSKTKFTKNANSTKKNTSVGDGDAVITKKTIGTSTSKLKEKCPKLVKSVSKSEDNLDHEDCSSIENSDCKLPEELDRPVEVKENESVKQIIKDEKKTLPEKLNKQQYVRPKSYKRKNRKPVMKDQQQYIREKFNSRSEVELSTHNLAESAVQKEAECNLNCRDSRANPYDSHFCCNCGQMIKEYYPSRGFISLCTVCQNLLGPEGPVDLESKDFGRSQVATRHTTSSTDVHFTSITLTKRVTFSSTNFRENERRPSVANILLKNYNSDSLHTIFKGHKKTATPNLGTSVYSLYSDSDKSSYSKIIEPDPRPRKPFLRRLMSCLVLRSRTSDIKVAAAPIPKIPSVNSSVDSYHISTSLGGIELSSSIYDTSASFFSSHSIQPISSKIKRGFLSSVREFLSNRRN